MGRTVIPVWFKNMALYHQ
jgi:hypothetical protein